MKNWNLLFILIVSLVPRLAFAQAPSKGSAEIKTLQKALNLDTVLATKLYNAIHVNEAEINNAIKNKAIKPLDKQNMVLSLLHQRENKIASVLNAQQLDAFKSLMNTQSGQIRIQKINEVDAKRENALRAQKQKNLSH